MAGENLVRTLQIIGAALGIPAAAAGSYAAYQNYFSTDETCHKLRINIISVMERNVAPETKRSLLRKDVTEFDKVCGESDPDARAIFQAALTSTDHAATADAGHGPAEASGAHAESGSQGAHPPQVGIFGAPGSREQHGWVALSRRKSDAWVPHFGGYEISESSLPEVNSVKTCSSA